MLLNLDKLEGLAQSTTESLGLRVYHLEMVTGPQGKTLRIYIDRQDKTKVSLEDCSNFSKAFSSKLDEEDFMEGSYNLEVSSPGVERVLVKPWHYLESVGETIFLQLNSPLPQEGNEGKALKNRKKIKGLLTKMEKDQLNLKSESMDLTIPIQMISKAHVVFDFAKS